MSELRPNRHNWTGPRPPAISASTSPRSRVLGIAGYLRPVETEPDERFAEADLKAFLARNADNGSGNLFTGNGGSVDPDELLRALDGRSDEMARRALDLFRVAFPEAGSWSLGSRPASSARPATGSRRSWPSPGREPCSTTPSWVTWPTWAPPPPAPVRPCPQLLAILRISRDLVVETAIDIVEEDGHRCGLAVSLLLARVLPVVDRLTDALVHGYWSSGASRQS